MLPNGVFCDIGFNCGDGLGAVGSVYVTDELGVIVTANFGDARNIVCAGVYRRPRAGIKVDDEVKMHCWVALDVR